MESVLFLAGIVLLLLGGDSAAKGASGLGQRLGLSPVAAGMLLLAFATSMPELAVNAYAVALGQTGLALGYAVGSNAVNLGLTLGLAATAAPLLVGMRLARAGLLLVPAAALAVLLFGLDGVIARWEGGVLLATFLAFLALSLRGASREGKTVQDELQDFADTRLGLGLNLSRFVVASVVLWFGARFVVQSAPALGAMLGLGTLPTGLVVVAIGTALPEIAVAAFAARRGQGNVVVGMAIGASAFNLLFILGGMALHQPLSLPGSFLRFELPAVMAFALALYPMLRGGSRLGKREGRILLAAFALWLAVELAMAWG
jgi:cation:H+ antiporter